MLLGMQSWCYFRKSVKVDATYHLMLVLLSIYNYSWHCFTPLLYRKTIVGVTLEKGLKVDANCFHCSPYFTYPLMQLQ